MISLVPVWAQHYDEFWQTIRRRNLWFIKLRYGAVIMLLFLIFTAELILNVKFTSKQELIILLITFSILSYNIILHFVRRFVKSGPSGFNPMHLSFVQMILDLYALTLLVYYTGTIESPLYLLFIFHMIIGSLILPGYIIYSIATAVIIIFISLAFGEYQELIPHNSLDGFLIFPFYNDLKFVTSFTTVFSFVMIMSVILANRITKQLYKMEQSLYESLQKINKAESEKQKYIMGIVHEIKSPLSAVHSYLNVILQKYLGPVNEKVEEKLIRTRVRSEEAIQLINDVLKISKLRLTDQVAVEEVEISLLILNIIRKEEENALSKNIKIAFRNNVKRNKLVKGDSFLINLALSNLINNAVKYISNDGCVNISLDEDPDNIVIKICDTGIGIPSGEKEKIFNDFYRASNVQKDFEGTGLGLSLVKQIVDKHNGSIAVKDYSEIDSNQIKGTCFIIKIPTTVI